MLHRMFKMSAISARHEYTISHG